MNYLIDAYNFGHMLAAARSWLQKGATQKAIPIILSAIQQRVKPRSKVVAVFDGRAENPGASVQSFANIRVLFSRKPQTADDIIRDFIRRQTKPELWTVVSSDTEIVYTARDMGAKTISSASFAKRGNESTKSTEPDDKYNPGKVDVAEWMRLFSGDDKQ